MISSKFCALVAGGVLLSGCAAMEGVGLPSMNDGDEEAVDASEGAAAYADISVITDSPERTARELDRYTVFENANCNRSSAQRTAFSSALDQLKARAGADGADMVRVLGTGSLSGRGICNNNVFQLTGVGYSEGERTQSAATTSESEASPADNLTARLEELEALEERGLINAEELEQLRSRVLDEAF